MFFIPSIIYQLADVNRLVWQTEGPTGPRAPFERTKEEIIASRDSFSVTINPMEIRTWLCSYSYM